LQRLKANQKFQSQAKLFVLSIDFLKSFRKKSTKNTHYKINRKKKWKSIFCSFDLIILVND